MAIHGIVWHGKDYAVERNEISEHEMKIFSILRSSPERWMTSKEIGQLCSSVALRTVRLHMQRFVKLGIVDLAEVFPAHRYKFSDKSAQRNKAYALRLEKAAEAFGVPFS